MDKPDLETFIKVTNLAMPRWELSFKLLTPDLIVGLDFEVFLFPIFGFHSFPHIFSKRPLFLFQLVWVCLCSRHPNVPSDRGFLSPRRNTSMSLTIHLWNVQSPNSTLKPWFSRIHAALVCSFPRSHIGRVSLGSFGAHSRDDVTY